MLIICSYNIVLKLFLQAIRLLTFNPVSYFSPFRFSQHHIPYQEKFFYYPWSLSAFFVFRQWAPTQFYWQVNSTQAVEWENAVQQKKHIYYTPQIQFCGLSLFEANRHLERKDW